MTGELNENVAEFTIPVQLVKRSKTNIQFVYIWHDFLTTIHFRCRLVSVDVYNSLYTCLLHHAIPLYYYLHILNF